jgi:hypothetical protein
MNKLKQVQQYSDPNEVMARGKALGIDVYLSANKNKKYAIINPTTNKVVNFGEIGYMDFTKHKDEKRRDNFKKRNNIWKDAKPYTAAYLSYRLLW